MMAMDTVDVEQCMQEETSYLRKLHANHRDEDLAARLRALRNRGWEIATISRSIGLSRAWLYVLLERHPDGAPPSDGPDLCDFRASPITMSMRFDPSHVPLPIAKHLGKLWRVVFRDRSAGTSTRAIALDTMIELLHRRGVPYMAIAQAGGVTHRAVIERHTRAQERKLLPPGLPSMLMLHRLSKARSLEQAAEARRQYAIVQVVATSFVRFYTLRDATETLFHFDPTREIPNELVEAGFSDFQVINDETDLIRAVSDAMTDISPIYAVPVHWLYVRSSATGLSPFWTSAQFNLERDFYPPGVEVPSIVSVPPAINWKERRSDGQAGIDIGAARAV
jgi:hypothetical protein